MSEENVDALPLTSVELLDAAIWREIESEEAQPASAFVEALSRLVGRWLLVRSDAPEMDAVTVLCKARGYIAARLRLKRRRSSGPNNPEGDQLELRFRLQRLQGAAWIEMLLTVAAVGKARLAGNQGTLPGNAGQMEEARS